MNRAPCGTQKVPSKFNQGARGCTMKDAILEFDLKKEQHHIRCSLWQILKEEISVGCHAILLSLSQNIYIWFRFPQHKGGVSMWKKADRRRLILGVFLMRQNKAYSISILKLVIIVWTSDEYVTPISASGVCVWNNEDEWPKQVVQVRG